MRRPGFKGGKGVAAIILIAAIGWHGWWMTRAWTSSAMPGHEFRQAQTAVTIHAMKEDGFRLDYSTPILGKPWSIPFEFPLYQYLVATFSPSTEDGEIQTGRAVSAASFYFGVLALALTWRALGGSAFGVAMGMTPLFFAPVYVFYSRSVLIEATAFCLAAWFLHFLVRYRTERKPWQQATALIAGVLAVLVKPTTWAVFCIPWALWGLHDVWRARRSGWRALRGIAEDVVLFGVPLLIVGLGWVWMADRIKEMNPMGGFLTSAQLASFNFGTLAQRADPQVLNRLWSQWQAGVIPGWSLIAATILIPFVARRFRALAVLGLLTFLLGQYIFINLYAIHDYYFYANAWAACLAVGAVVIGLWERPARWYLGRLSAVVLLLLTIGGQFAAYRGGLYQEQVTPNSGTSALITAVSKIVPRNQIVVMHSEDWSSLLAYRTGRRMLMIPDSQMYLRPEAVGKSIERLHDERVPLVLFRGHSHEHPEWIAARIEDFGLEPYPLFCWSDVVAYAARDVFQDMFRTLERENYAGFALDPSARAVKLADFIAIRGTPEETLFSNMDPVPTRGSLPYGIREVVVENQKFMFAHSPTELHFPIPSGASRVEIGYRMDPAVYGQPDFDGVDIEIEVRSSALAPVVLYHERLLPGGDRTPRRLSVSLKSRSHDTLVVRCYPGPSHNNAYDWALIEYVRIR